MRYGILHQSRLTIEHYRRAFSLRESLQRYRSSRKANPAPIDVTDITDFTPLSDADIAALPEVLREWLDSVKERFETLDFTYNRVMRVASSNTTHLHAVAFAPHAALHIASILTETGYLHENVTAYTFNEEGEVIIASNGNHLISQQISRAGPWTVQAVSVPNEPTLSVVNRAEALGMITETPSTTWNDIHAAHITATNDWLIDNGIVELISAPENTDESTSGAHP